MAFLNFIVPVVSHVCVETYRDIDAVPVMALQRHRSGMVLTGSPHLSHAVWCNIRI